MKEHILITSATGNTGYPTTVNLLKEGYCIFVRSRNAAALELERLGAEIAIGDFNSYEQIAQALHGIHRVYYCYPIMRNMPENVAHFIRAAKECSVETVVFMGQWLAEFEGQKSILTQNIRQSYKLLEVSGLKVIYFIPGYFAQQVFVSLQFIVQLGMLSMPWDKGKNP